MLNRTFTIPDDIPDWEDPNATVTLATYRTEDPDMILLEWSQRVLMPKYRMDQLQYVLDVETLSRDYKESAIEALIEEYSGPYIPDEE